MVSVRTPPYKGAAAIESGTESVPPDVLSRLCNLGRIVGAVYLTGVPGTGKSSTLAALQRSVRFHLTTFSYSENLGMHLGRTREELRAESSAVVASSAVLAVDRELAEFVAANRATSIVVIDSHAVTHEDFGQRAIPFHPAVLASLQLDAIVCMTARAESIAYRVAADSTGRRLRTIDQIARAQDLQQAVAVNYSAQLGIPLYVVEADGPANEVRATLETVLIRALHT